MIWTIARKEFLTSLLTYRFLVGLVLCLVSVVAGTLAAVQDLRSRQEAFGQAVAKYEEQLKQEATYGRLVFELKAFREPRRLAVFSVGSDRWQGNEVLVTHHHVPEEAQWLGAANPYLAIFRSIDVTQVVAFVLGLLALLFAHDAICGEREEGTLRMMLANRVPRDQVLLGKAVGHLGVLGVILLAGYLTAAIVMQASLQTVLSGSELARLGTMLAVSALYVAALYFAGLYLSTLVARPVTALVLAVTAWVVAVAVFPNAVAYGVEQLTPMQAVLKSAGATREQLDHLFEGASDRLLQAQGGPETTGSMQGSARMTAGVFPSIWSFFQGVSASNQEHITGYIEGSFPTRESVDALLRNAGPQLAAMLVSLRQQGQTAAAEALEAGARGDWEALARGAESLRQAGVSLPPLPVPATELDRRVHLLRGFFGQRERLRIEFADRVYVEGWQPVEERMRMASRWSRILGLISPAGAYQDASAILSRTDRGDYWRFLDQTRGYRRQLIAHYEEQGYFTAREWFNDQAGKVTLVGLPHFREASESTWQGLQRARASLLVLIGFCLLGFLGTYWRFRRCDVR